MSEKESKFMQILTSVLGGFLLAVAIGMFSFYRVTIVNAAVQNERISTNEIKVETMRTEIRQDLKEIKSDIKELSRSIK